MIRQGMPMGGTRYYGNGTEADGVGRASQTSEERGRRASASAGWRGVPLLDAVAGAAAIPGGLLRAGRAGGAGARTGVGPADLGCHTVAEQRLSTAAAHPAARPGPLSLRVGTALWGLLRVRAGCPGSE